MGVVQKLFLSGESRLPMKYIIPEIIFDMTDIWSSAYIDLQVRFYTYSRGGIIKKVHNYKDVNDNISIKSIPVKHGKINSLCYIINQKCAYASDINEIYKKDLNYFFNLKYLIIDCLRNDPHYSHFNLKNVLDLVKVIKPEKTILTNLNHEMDYNQLKKKLPNNITPAFDGMTLLI